MTDEDAFLRKLLDNPADDVVRLIYADWLDERGDAAKAEFLRLEAETATAKSRRRKQIDTRLQALAADLDTKWLAVVSKLMIEHCEQERSRGRYEFEQEVLGQNPHLTRDADYVATPAPAFEFECPLRWENLTVTDDPNVRLCNGCDQTVHYCDTIVTARDHAAQGRCVAVDLGIRRRTGDLKPVWEIMGMISEDGFAAIEKQRQVATHVDPVSEKREAAKRRDDPV